MGTTIITRYFFICIVVILFLFITPGIFAQIFIGDVNDDGNVDIVDALLIAQYYVGLNPPQFLMEQAGDVNCDDLIDIVDALLIAQYYVEVIPKLPCDDSPTGESTEEPTAGPTETPYATPSGNINLIGAYETSVGHRERWTNSVFIAGYFYVTSLRGIKIFQTTDKQSPVFIKDTNIGENTELLYLELSGNLLIGLDVLRDELLLIDVSDPLNPYVVNTIISYDITDFAHKENYIFIAVEDSLIVLNITNPLHPIEEVTLSERSAALFLAGNLLYSIIDDSSISNDFKIFDVSSPTNPVLISSVEQEGSDICISGNYAYIRYSPYLRIYDISNPYNPFQVYPSSTTSIDLRFFYFNQGYYPQSLYKTGNTLCHARAGGMTMIDVSDITDINSGVWTALPGLTSGDNSVALSYTEGNLFITSSDMKFGSSIKYLDTTVPSGPVLNDFIEGRGCAYGPYLNSSNKVYLPDGMGGIKIFDTTNPGNLILSDIISGEFIIDMIPRDNYLYGLDRDLLMIDSMTDQVIDYPNKIDSGYQCQSITSYDDYLYIPRFPFYIRIIDISNPGQPVISSDLMLMPALVPTGEPIPVQGTPAPTSTPNPTCTPAPYPSLEPLEILFHNNYGYLIQTLRPNLRIFDMSEPLAPAEVGGYYPDKVSRTFKDIVLQDDLLYIAANDGLLIFSIADPISPVLLSYTEIPGIKKLVKDSHYCFMVQEPSSLVVVDVSDVSDPRIIESIDTGIYIEDAAVLNGTIYCGNGQEKTYMSIYSYY